MKKENRELIDNYYKFLKDNNLNWSPYGYFTPLRETTNEESVLYAKRDELEKEIEDKIDLFKGQKHILFLRGISIFMNIHNKIEMFKNLHKNIFEMFYRIMKNYNYTEENLINVLCEEYYHNEDEENYIGILKGIQGFKIKRYEEKIIELEERYRSQELKGKKNKQYYSNLRGNINHLIRCKSDLINDYETLSHYLSKYQLERKLNKLANKPKAKGRIDNGSSRRKI